MKYFSLEHMWDILLEYITNSFFLTFPAKKGHCWRDELSSFELLKALQLHFSWPIFPHKQFLSLFLHYFAVCLFRFQILQINLLQVVYTYAVMSWVVSSCTFYFYDSIRSASNLRVFVLRNPTSKHHLKSFSNSTTSKNKQWLQFHLHLFQIA